MTKSNISKAIEGESENLVFKPTRKFYVSVGINSKRWGLIYRGDIEPTLSEIEAIANYFNLPVVIFFNQTHEAQA
jgi:hypothetical protein